MQSASRTALSNLSACWEGRAATSFASSNEQWRNEMRTIESEINDVANHIQRTADNIRTADERSAALNTGQS
jgi:WXG100 family type VII secretion target